MTSPAACAACRRGSIAEFVVMIVMIVMIAHPSVPLAHASCTGMSTKDAGSRICDGSRPGLPGDVMSRAKRIELRAQERHSRHDGLLDAIGRHTPPSLR